MVYVQMANYSKNDSCAFFLGGGGRGEGKTRTYYAWAIHVKVANGSRHSTGHYCLLVLFLLCCFVLCFSPSYSQV